MASRRLQIALVLVLGAFFWESATAQPNLNCNNTLTTMAPCLNFLVGNSSTPSSSCCSQLDGVAKSAPDCLCGALNGSVPTIGININRTIALTLPDACQLQSTSINQCKQSITAGASPLGSPSTTSPSSSSSNSSKTTPPPASGSGSTSDGGIGRAPIHFVLFLVFMALCASTITKF